MRPNAHVHRTPPLPASELLGCEGARVYERFFRRFAFAFENFLTRPSQLAFASRFRPVVPEYKARPAALTSTRHTKRPLGPYPQTVSPRFPSGISSSCIK